MSVSTAIPANTVARTIGIKTEFQQLRGNNNAFILPQRVAVVGVGSSSVSYSTTESRTVTSSLQAGQIFGFGSPVHLAVRQLLPDIGEGVGQIPVTVYPVAQTGDAATGTITVTGTKVGSTTYFVRVGNHLTTSITIADATSVADTATAIANAINANVNMPVTAAAAAGVVTLTSKHTGLSANSITFAVLSPDGLGGLTFALAAMSGGTGTPALTDALNLIGQTWETLIVNCFTESDTTAIDAISTWGEGRWGALNHMPAVSFVGSRTTSPSDLGTNLTNTRRTQRTNALVAVPGSNDLPWEIAAGAVAQVANLAQINPPHDYGGRALPNLVAGGANQQWDFDDRNVAVTTGVTTTEVINGQLSLSDTVTFYRPANEPNPGYRFVVDIIKLQNIIYNIALRFNSSDWNGAPLIPDGQFSSNRTAKSPKLARSLLNGLTISFGDEAIISDPDFTNTNTVVAINSTNSKRLDVTYPVKLSGNTNQVAVDLDFGFFFGS